MNRFDWASWDDTYNFIQDRNEAYIASNLYPEGLARINVNFLLFINTSGQLVFGKAIDLRSLEETPLSQNLTDYVSGTPLLWRFSDVNSTVSGIILVDETPILISSKPILNSQGLGPIHGALIAGRYLNLQEVDSLSKSTHLPIELARVDDSKMAPDFKLALSSLSSKTPIFVNPINSSYVAGYSIIKDVEESPILIIKASIFRDVYIQGEESISFLAISLFLVGIAFSVLILRLLSRSVISPLTRLDKEVKAISKSPLSSNRLHIKGNDEFVSLSKSVNEMVDSLEQAQKLAGIGQLTNMVAHDLRNPLQSISMATYGLKKKLSSNPDMDTSKLLNIIETSVKYSDKIVSDLLDYSREIRLEPSEFNLSQLVKEVLQSIEVPREVDVVNKIAEDIAMKADIFKLKRVFVNIIKNAVEAMPKGGILSLSSLTENGNLEVAFADTGVGISVDALEKMGKPLFTTKSKGMGLGFVISKRIVEAHGGSISVKSEVGKGTIIKVKLPAKQ
jgi:signal transduction histidine kinase